MPHSAVALRWPDWTRLTSTTVDAAGNGSATFSTPLTPLGTYRIEARDGAGRIARASLSVIPRIMLNIDEGWSSTRVRVYLYGFAVGERVEVRWYATDGASHAVVATVTIAANGRGSSLFDIPASTGVGTHKVMGRVVGVARSASTTFRVTPAAGASDRSAPPVASKPVATSTSTMPATPRTSTVTPTATPITSPTPTSSPTGTPPPDPAATATPTATPTASPEPTAEPTPTATSEPTDEPEPTPEATAVPTPDPTAPAEADPPEDGP